MENKKKKEISFTEGSAFWAIIRFAVPVFGAMVLQAAYGAVDLIIVGFFGDAASISAVGTGSSFMQMITLIITSLAMGATVVIGQYIGENRPDKAGDTVGTTIIIFVVLGIILTVLLELFATGIAGILQVPEESFDKAVTYLRICSGGILVIIAYNVISSVLRGVGNAKLPFIFVCIACVVNIVGDLFFVAVLGLDAAGAAIATVLAQFVSVVVSLPVMKHQNLPFSFSLKRIKIHPNKTRRIISVGVPIAVQEAMVQVSFLVINSIVNNMGLMPSAGYGVAQKLVSFIMLIPSTVMQSVSAFVAQNIGAGNSKRAKQGFYTTVVTGCCLGALIFCMGFFKGDLMSAMFTNETDVIAQSAAYLKGFSAECILTCILFGSTGYFNGSGKSLPVMIQGIASAFLIRIPVATFMSRLPDTSLTYIGMATPITTFCGIIFFLVCFRIYGKKEKKGL
ncbi:MAG: MATE family efflux transporter [Clostridiales bacterium]|nr:MATE family efflux transporter [Clostridiales bacterium]